MTARERLVPRLPARTPGRLRGLEAPATAKARAAIDRVRRGAADSVPLLGLSASQIKHRIAAAAKAAGLEGVSSHGCRIGMAQDLARAKGIEMPAIMQAGGWRSESTVARYTARETAARGAVARFYEQEGEAATGKARTRAPKGVSAR